jgi:hypothetical protein
VAFCGECPHWEGEGRFEGKNFMDEGILPGVYPFFEVKMRLHPMFMGVR